MAEIQRGYKFGNIEQPKRRKIIQIVCTAGGSDGWNHVTTALCSDGSVWKLRDGINSLWVRLPEIPQTD